MENVVDFKLRLKEAMDFNGINQSKLSEITGINNSTINEYLKGRYEPNRERISKFAEVLNVSEVWLMGYEVSMQRPNPRKLSNTEKKEILNDIKHIAKEQNINIAALKIKYNLDYYDVNIDDNILKKMAKDFKVNINIGNYLSKNVQSKNKKWFYDVIENLEEEELVTLKNLVEPMLELIKK